MELVINVLKILLGAILLIVGIGLRKAFKSTEMELKLTGDQYYAPGYKRRRFILFFFGYTFILLSLYILYTVIF